MIGGRTSINPELYGQPIYPSKIKANNSSDREKF
jgi:hypothetical protein